MSKCRSCVPLVVLTFLTKVKVGVFVENLTSNVVTSACDVRGLLDYGHQIRVVACTNMNAVSSRSHAVVTLNVEKTVNTDGARKKRRAQLHCVDLAGSERYKQVGESKLRQAESKQINTSLLALSLTISRLAEGGSKAHVNVLDMVLCASANHWVCGVAGQGPRDRKRNQHVWAHVGREQHGI